MKKLEIEKNHLSKLPTFVLPSMAIPMADLIA